MNELQMAEFFRRLDERDKKLHEMKRPWFLDPKNMTAVIMAAGTLFSSFAGFIYAIRNNEKIEEVQVVQTENKATAQEVKTTLEVATKKQEKSLESLEDAIGPNLWASWKYAEDTWKESGLVRDKEKADEAKAKYDSHIAKMRAAGKTIK